MEYVYLACACGFFSIQFIFTKLYQKRTDGTLHAAMWCTLLSALSMLVIFFPANLIGSGRLLAIAPTAWLWGSIYAVCGVVCGACTILALKHGSVAAITVYTLLGGMVLPFLYGVLALGEQPSVWRYIGTAILIVSILPPLLMNSKPAGGEKRSLRSRITFTVCVILIFLTNGGVSVVTTASQRDEAMQAVMNETDFLLVTAILRVVLAAAIIVALSLRQRRSLMPTDAHTDKPATLAVLGLLAGIILVYSAFNGIGNFFNLACAKTMDASLQFPIISAACITLSALWALLFFREKPSKGDLIGIVLSLAGIVLYIF